MALPARWGEAVGSRRSRRSYDGRAVGGADLERMEALAEGFRPWPGARAIVVREARSSIFMGAAGTYAGISGAPSALLFVGAARADAAAVGYTGEALVLEATARGLDTCWVGALFSAAAIRRSVFLEAGEHVFAVSALGHATPRRSFKERVLSGSARAKRRHEMSMIAPGWETWPSWARTAVGMARVAPSALNRQPWRFRLDGPELVISQDGVATPRISRRLDCGIAMLHAELGAASEGVDGRWELLTSPDVARFVPGIAP